MPGPSSSFFCHAGDTEIGGFGITERDDLLLVTDFVTVAQRVSSVTVAFDDAAVADFVDDQVDAGPQAFAIPQLLAAYPSR